MIDLLFFKCNENKNRIYYTTQNKLLTNKKLN